MSPEKLYWSLFDEATGRQIDGLTFTQAKTIVATLTPEALHSWFAWYEGLMHWCRVRDLPLLHGTERGNELRMPPLVPPPGRASEAESPLGNGKIPVFEFREDDNENEIEIDFRKKTDRRLNRRFLINLEVLIISGGGTFESSTVDVSLGGMRLKDPLPTWLGNKFKVRLSHKSRSVDLNCQQIATHNGRATDRVRITDAINQDTLLTLILDLGKERQ